MDRRQDPRSIVTPYAFAVHPDLLGRPLATPVQRLGAILVDLVVIGIISQIGGAPLAFASAILLFWLAFRKPGRDVFGKLFRIAVGCLGFLVLTVSVAVVVFLRYGDRIIPESEGSGAAVTVEGVPPSLPGDVTDSDSSEESVTPGRGGLLGVVQSARSAMAFQSAEDREEAQEVADRLTRDFLEMGLPRTEIRSVLAGFIPEDASWAEDAEEIVTHAMRGLEPEEGPETGVAEAVGPGEESPPSETTPAAIQDPRALDSIAVLNQELTEIAEERADLADQLERADSALAEAEAENRSLFDRLKGLIDDLGLGFGWGALYLTITHAWWNGTSVGKKLFRIRVVMIDKRRLTWWLSFERAGGYAAGLATGLLGFAQVFWDPNRQAIHDKVSETIVIQDGKDPIPGPWMEEGKAQWSQEKHGGGNPE